MYGVTNHHERSGEISPGTEDLFGNDGAVMDEEKFFSHFHFNLLANRLEGQGTRARPSTIVDLCETNPNTNQIYP